MADKKIPCRVCGKLFKPCLSCQAQQMRSWRTFACSPQCGQEYLRRKMEQKSNPKL